MGAKRKKQNGKPDPAILQIIVREVVEAAKPEKIVLFGSAARGTMGPNSDYDILVIKKGRFSHDRVAEAIYRNLSGEAPVERRGRFGNGGRALPRRLLSGNLSRPSRGAGDL